MKKFKIIEVKEISTANGNKFTAFKTVGKGGRKMDVRFRKEIGPDKLPKEPCFIEVEDENCNIDTTRQYPILWIKAIENIIPFERTNKVDEFFE